MTFCTGRTGVSLILVLTGLALLVLLRDIVLLTFLAVLIAVILDFPVRLLSRWMSRGTAVILILIAGGGGLVGLGYLTLQPVSAQLSQLEEEIPKAIDRARSWLNETGKTGPVGQIAPGQPVTGQIQKRLGSLLESLLSQIGPAAISLTSVISALVLLIVMAAFFAYEPCVYFESLETLLPRTSERPYEELWRRRATGLRHWLGGTLIAMTIMGVFTALGLLIAGVQDWYLLGILTFFGTFVPYVGAISSAIPGLIIALSQSTQHFLYAMIVYLCVHIVEGYIVQPIMMKRAIVIHPAILLLWQVTMGVLGGILGLIVATPLFACLKIIVGYLYIERKLGKEAPKV